MKHSIRLFFVMTALLFSVQSIAGESRGNVRDTMKQMGRRFRILAQAYLKNESVPIEDVKGSADSLVQLVEQASKEAPNDFRTWGGEIREDAKEQMKKYDELMARLLMEAKNLRNAIHLGDHETAAQIMRERLTRIMREGHDLFAD